MTSVYVQRNCTVDVPSLKEEVSAFAVSRGLGDLSWVEGKSKGKDACKDLTKLIRSCSSGDAVIVHEVTRICRALSKIYEMLVLCQERGVRFYSIREGYSFGDPVTGQLITYAFGMAVEAEKRIRSSSTREGLADLKATGAKLGRRVGSATKLNHLEENKQSIATMTREGDNVKEISHKLGVSYSTMYKYLRMHPELMAAKA